MNNKYIELANLFYEISKLEKLKGNHFPSIAFYKSAGLINSASNIKFDANNRITVTINGSDLMLGSSTSWIAKEFIDTNKSNRLESLRKELNIPEDNSVMINQLTRIAGIGEVKSKVILKSNSYTDLNDFISKLPKVGEYIGNSKIRFTSMMYTGVRLLQLTSGKRLPWVDANKLANKIIYSVVNKVSYQFYVYKLGSLRRHKDTVGDIDLVISNCDESKFEDLRNLFSKELDHLLVNGKSKISGIKSGFQVDIRFIPEKFLGCHILHGTGSADFNVKLRSHAKSLGMRLNEYGILDKIGVFHTFKNEFEVFKFLGIPYVKPNNR